MRAKRALVRSSGVRVGSESSQPRDDTILLTVAEAANELRLHRSTVAQLIARREISSILIGRRGRRVPRSALLEYVGRKLREEREE